MILHTVLMMRWNEAQCEFIPLTKVEQEWILPCTAADVC
jgi:hypothetical protein